MAQPFHIGALLNDAASASALRSFPVTPHDTNELADHIRAITINVGGTLAWTSWDGTESTTAALPAGTYALLAKRIKSTGTTATGITGWV